MASLIKPTALAAIMVGERVARVSKELPGRATLRPAKKVERVLCALDGAAPARAVVIAIVVFFFVFFL